MRITEIDIPKSPDVGLEAVKMSRLGKVVLIAGKNGAGKTRLLNKIFTMFSQKPKQSLVTKSLKDMGTYQQNILACQHQIEMAEKQLQTSQLNEAQRKSIEQQNTAILQCKTIQEWNAIKTDVLSEVYTSIQFVPKSLTITDSSSFSKKDLLTNAKNVETIGVANLSKGTFAKIQVIQDIRYNTSHQESTATPEEKQKADADYKRLKEIITAVLGTDIGRTNNGEATLFGFPLGLSNLSPGQFILLQLCIAIYSQEVALKDLILVLDEPENHLHPSVIIDTIQRLQNCVSNGQIWIATHSVPLLAHFDMSCLWYVEAGQKITYAGRTPERVLESLLGKEDEIAKLHDFISLPAQFATNQYAFESLLEPKALVTGTNDPQIRQIKNELLSLNSTGKIRILDYGAGKGRLISNLADLDGNSQKKMTEQMDYIAFDKYPNDKIICEESIKRVFGESNGRYYNDLDALLAAHSRESFDVVIMCNVLHEIDPKEWLKLFLPDGEISKCLKDNGILILVEDCQIPVGEMAYQNGFLVLDTLHLKDLFCITEQDRGFTVSQFDESGRVKVHQIPKTLLTRITKESRSKAIKAISDTAKTRIADIRRAEKNYKNGKLHGFWTQQFANAQLNLAELGEPT
ncbi:MAG: hypothetical protein Ta2B_13600 [Termitinemataceae bacterium]|nr:MAG: hypothetical protein Ta2B_13600 [Termitinemataceae bacterium]